MSDSASPLTTPAVDSLSTAVDPASLEKKIEEKIKKEFEFVTEEKVVEVPVDTFKPTAPSRSQPKTKKPKRAARTRRRGGDDSGSDADANVSDASGHSGSGASSAGSDTDSASGFESESDKDDGRPDRSGGEEEDSTLPSTERTPDDVNTGMRPTPLPQTSPPAGLTPTGVQTPVDAATEIHKDKDEDTDADKNKLMEGQPPIDLLDASAGDGTIEVVDFKEFSRHGSKAQGQRKTSEEWEKQIAEKKAKKVAKMKEKRKAKREAVKQEKQGPAGSPSTMKKPTGGKSGVDGQTDDAEPSQSTSTADTNTNTTVAATPTETATPHQLQSPTGPSGGRMNNRQAYQERISKDPSFVPRVGKFWTHDARLYTPGKFGAGNSDYSGLREMSDYWRGRGGRGGRGGFPRGGIRGGLPIRGGFDHVGRGRGGHMGGHVLMPRTVPVPVPVPGPTAQVTSVAEPEKEPTTQSIEGPAIGIEDQEISVEPTHSSLVATVPATNNRRMPLFTEGRSDRGAWNHDGFFEQLEKQEARIAAHRGRGRGAMRGAPPMPRGGFRGGFRGLPFAPAAMRGGRGGRPMVPQSAVPVAGATGIIPNDFPALPSIAPTGPVANDALAETDRSHAVSMATETADLVHPKVSSLPPNAPQPEIHVSGIGSSESAIALNLQLQAEVASLRQQQDLMRRRELKLQDEMRRLEIGQRRASSSMGGSDGASVTGSLPGAHVSTTNPQAQSYIPPGVGVSDTGSYYDVATGQPLMFLPNPSPAPAQAGARVPSQSSESYQPYPQSQSPYYSQHESYPAESALPPHLQHRAQNSGAGFSPFAPNYGGPNSGRESPYPSSSYFAPPPPTSRVQIRAPGASDTSASGRSDDKQTQQFSPNLNDHQSPPTASSYSYPSAYTQGQNQQQMMSRSYYPMMDGNESQMYQQAQQPSYGYGYNGGYNHYQ